MSFDHCVFYGSTFAGGPLVGASVCHRYLDMPAGSGICCGVAFAVADIVAVWALLSEVKILTGIQSRNGCNFGHTGWQSFGSRAVCQIVGGLALYGVFKLFERAITWQQAAVFVGAQIAMNALCVVSIADEKAYNSRTV